MGKLLGHFRLVVQPWPIRPLPLVSVLFLFQILVNFATVGANARAKGEWPTAQQYLATVPSIILGSLVGFLVLWFLEQITKKYPKYFAVGYCAGAVIFGVTLAASRHLTINASTPDFWADPQSSVRIVVATTLFYLTMHISLGVSSQRLAEQAKVAEQARASLEVQRGKLIFAQEDIRRQIADFLHDRLQSDLVLLGMQMQKFTEKLDEQDKAVAQAYIDEIERIRQFDVRSVSKQLTPELSGPSIRPAIEDLASRYAKVMTIRIDILEQGKLTHLLKLASYRIIEQALLNAAKHANAQKVDIIIQELKDELTISVKNDGQPLANQPVAGAGFAIIEDWVSQYNGSWSLAPLGEETQLKVSLNF